MDRTHSGAAATTSCCGAPLAPCQQRRQLIVRLPLSLRETRVCRQRACTSRRQSTLVVASASPGAPTEQSTGKQRCCYGCGEALQTTDNTSAGYVPPAKYEEKARHKQLSQLLCARCQALSNGAMIPAVEDLSLKLMSSARTQTSPTSPTPPSPSSRSPAAAPTSSDAGGGGSASPEGASGSEGGGTGASTASQPLELGGKRLVTPEQLRERLRGVASQKCVVVLLVDLLDASGSFLSRARDLVGKNPIVLVGTKSDLLPHGTKPAEVVEWLLATAAHKKLNAVSAHLVSSRTGAGLGAATAALRRERRGRDVYVLGAANVGKSAFVRAMVREMSSHTSAHFDPAAAGASKRLPVESAMPGTTLGLIPMKTFSAGGTLYDTPGVHLHHRLIHLLDADDIKALQPRRQLRPYIPPTPRDVCEEMALEDELAAAGGGEAQQQQQQHEEKEDQEEGSGTLLEYQPLGTSPKAGGHEWQERGGLAGEGEGAADGEKDAVAGGLGSSGDADADGVARALHQAGWGGAAPAAADPSGVPAAAAAQVPAWDASDEELLALFGPLVGAGGGLGGPAPPAGPGAGAGRAPRGNRASRRREDPSEPPSSATYLWGGLARIDVVSCPPATHLVFYGPPAAEVAALPLLGLDDVVELDQEDEREEEQTGLEHGADDNGGADSGNVGGGGGGSGGSGGLLGYDSVERRGGLRVVKEVDVEAPGTRGPLVDVVFSGLPGWVQLYAPRDRGVVRLRLWAPRGVEVFVRPPIPVPSPLT